MSLSSPYLSSSSPAFFHPSPSLSKAISHSFLSLRNTAAVPLAGRHMWQIAWIQFACVIKFAKRFKMLHLKLPAT